MILCCTLFCCFTAPCSAFSEDSNAQSGTDEPINRPPLSTPESYVSSDGQYYYDAVHDAYYSNIVRVIDGIVTDISPSEYAAEVAAAAENAYLSASSVLNADIPSIEPLANTYFYKFNKKMCLDLGLILPILMSSPDWLVREQLLLRNSLKAFLRNSLSVSTLQNRPQSPV